METLDKLPGIIGYVVTNVEDGATEELRGSSSAPIGDLTAFFASASEVIKDNLSLGTISYISLSYGAHRLVVFAHESKYLGVEIERDNDPTEFIKKFKSAAAGVREPTVTIPHSISSKIKQINLVVEEFGGQDNKEHWLELLNQGLGILGGDMLPYVGIVRGFLTFKGTMPADKEDEFVQGLRATIDFLAKKAVEEMGSSQARAKIHAVIEKMR